MRWVLSRRERASHERLAGACAADEADNLPAEWFCEMHPYGLACQEASELNVEPQYVGDDTAASQIAKQRATGPKCSQMERDHVA